MIIFIFIFIGGSNKMKKTTRLLLFAAAVAVLFALAAFGVSAAEYNEDGSTMDATLASALADAENEDVTINLSGTWTFAGDTVYGSSASIPTHTITINGDPDGDTVLDGEISSGGNMVTLWGNFVFTNVKFTGALSTTASPRIDAKNGLYFPEGCSCVIASGCDGYTDGTNGFNLAGD